MGPVFAFARAISLSGKGSYDDKEEINIFYQKSSYPFNRSTYSTRLSEAFWAEEKKKRQLAFW